MEYSMLKKEGTKQLGKLLLQILNASVGEKNLFKNASNNNS